VAEISGNDANLPADISQEGKCSSPFYERDVDLGLLKMITEKATD
jgi:hypothetical protein